MSSSYYGDQHGNNVVLDRYGSNTVHKIRFIGDRQKALAALEAQNPDMAALVRGYYIKQQYLEDAPECCR